MIRDGYQLDLFQAVDEPFNPRDTLVFGDTNLYWDTYNITSNPTHRLFEPWFKGGNNETAYLTHLLTNNPIVMGLVITKCDILRGRRLTIFDKNEKDSTTGKPVAVELSDYPEIQDFYEYNQLNLYAYDAFFHEGIVGNYFSEMVFSRGSSRSEKKVTDLVNITPECIRAVRDKGPRKRVHSYGVSDKWSYDLVQKSVETIPAFYQRDFYDNNRGFKRNDAPASVMFHGKRHIPHFPIYSIPRWYGARHWLETQNLVPIFHKNNLANMFGLRMQINVAKALVDRLAEQGDGKGNKYTQKDVLDNIAASSTKFFTNPGNAGKSIATAFDMDDRGNMVKDMTFEKISLDLNDDAYSKLDSMMSQSVTSSMGTSPSLAGIIMNQNLPSGSEQRYAWNIEVVKGAFIRDMVLEPIRFAHKFNKWPSNLEWGFEQDVMVTADVTPTGQQPQVPPQQ